MFKYVKDLYDRLVCWRKGHLMDVDSTGFWFCWRCGYNVEPSVFGKDHWSLLAYVETRCVDNSGELDREHMRCNPLNHEMLQGYRAVGKWKDEYSTHLNDGVQVIEHDDWNCLEDLENFGMLVIISLINGFVVMTDEGTDLAHQVRKHKANGGNFASFKPVKAV